MPLIRRRKRRWDEQPSIPASVLLVSDGGRPISSGAVARAAALAAESPHPVAVVAVAKIHGTSFGLPNPGLMPTKAELAERTGWVDAAIKDLATRGLRADGQVATTRRAVKLFAKIARLRGVSTVVIDGTPAGRGKKSRAVSHVEQMCDSRCSGTPANSRPVQPGD